MTIASPHRSGFTLIELSIVLVIIGLIVGGVLVGQDLINAAVVRSQITQIERYNTAVNAFVSKYGYLPGDIPGSLVTTLGFPAAPTRAGTAGRGDGNGLIEGYRYPNLGVVDGFQSGEPSWFWEDLTTNSGFIPGSFNTATDAAFTLGYQYTDCSPPMPTQYCVDLIFPKAAIGNANYIIVYSLNGQNYFSLLQAPSVGGPAGGYVGVTVSQAFAIDKKIDDGLPQSGKVTAQYENWWESYALQIGNYGVLWAASGQMAGASPGTSATGSSSTCYDNGGGSGMMQYSMEINNGALTNCSLSFQMQGAAR